MRSADRGTRAPRIDAVVFDCDGTLADTQPIWDQAINLCARELGVDLGSGDLATLRGLDVTQIAVELKRRVRGVWTSARIEDLFIHALNEAPASDFRPMPGAVELVGRLAGRIPIGVASNGPPKFVRRTLEQCGLAAHVSVVVTGSSVAAPKPAPDVYRAACGLLGVEPRYSLAFEDSKVGLASAASAGLRVVLVGHEGLPARTRHRAHLRVPTLAHPRVEALFTRVTDAPTDPSRQASKH